MKNKIVKNIDINNLDLLQDFIDNMGSSNKTFRYFDKRGLSCISNHIVTVLFLEDKDEKPIAYGHLDKEGDNIWLGIAVKEGYAGLDRDWETI